MDRARIASLFRYPVKGLSPEPMTEVRLETDAYFPGDRLFAIENGPSGYDEHAPTHLPKTKFLMLMRNERLAHLRSRYEAANRHLAIMLDGRLVCDGDLSAPEGRATLEGFLADFCADELQGAPRLRLAQPGFRFTDSRQGFVSLVNLASVRAVEAAEGRAVDPLRFRANIYFDGPPAWAENAWVGRQLRVGDTRLEVTSTTERCAATSVDPQTGARDMNIVKTLVQRFGHNLCGVYARVVEGGALRPGDVFNG